MPGAEPCACPSRGDLSSGDGIVGHGERSNSPPASPGPRGRPPLPWAGGAEVRREWSARVAGELLERTCMWWWLTPATSPGDTCADL
mmetsp:Transcript_11193/g.30277  ORF Transcript_11193/g.30277 Transcript_11193/m.30277 type:complete len:87 (-) Transcript_11193:360-620(-)